MKFIIALALCAIVAVEGYGYGHGFDGDFVVGGDYGLDTVRGDYGLGGGVIPIKYFHPHFDYTERLVKKMKGYDRNWARTIHDKQVERQRSKLHGQSLTKYPIPYVYGNVGF